MKTFIVRSTQKYTGYQVCKYEVQADTPEEAKDIVLDGGGTEIDTWDTDTDDYEFTEPDLWEITKDE